MFSLAKIRDGSTYLSHHLSANDYWWKDETVTGRWVGHGADALGLSGEVGHDQFEALRVNEHPIRGGRLTPRTKSTRQPTMREAAKAFRDEHGRQGSKAEVSVYPKTMKEVGNRVAFFDFQCSAQKSVSIMAVLAGDKRLYAAHRRATTEALAELESFACRQNNTPTRRQVVMTGNICAAAFTHDASRALDPQLHTHFVVANATQDPQSGKWYALNEYHMVKAVRYAGKVYQNALAREVMALGYGIRHVREKGAVTGFEIEGVSDEMLERFAKRRAVIEKEIEVFQQERGREPTAKEVAILTRESRGSAKLQEIATADVRAQQRAQLRSGEWDGLQTLRTDAQLRWANGITPQIAVPSETLAASVEHLFERRSVLTAHDVLAEAINQSLGTADVAALKRHAEASTDELVTLARHGQHGLLSEVGTRRGLALEQWAVAYVDATRDACQPLNAAFAPGAGLSGEQRLAVEAILNAPDRVMSFRGAAGAGKTTTLREVQAGLVETGHYVIAIAPTAKAAGVLREGGFPDATTAAAFFLQADKRDDLRGAVVICDEAGLKSNRQGAELLRLADKNDMRVLLVGDVRQHVSVEAGDFLRLLESHSQMARVEVGEIWRQQDPAYRSAMQQMADGDVHTGLESLDKLGWIKEGRADYLKAAATDYLKLSKEGREADKCLAVAPTWNEIDAMTADIRAGLKECGRLEETGRTYEVVVSLDWTEQQKRDGRNYAPGQVVRMTQPNGEWQAGTTARVVDCDNGCITVATPAGEHRLLDLKAADRFEVARSRQLEVAPGDRILIRANDKDRGLVNGQTLTVSEITNDGSMRTREGITVPPAFRQWSHGYVVTSHKAQGATCQHVIVAADRLDAKAAYVGCSRGVRTCTVHTPDNQRLMEGIGPSNRLSAMDVLKRERRQACSPAMAHRPQAWTETFGDRIAQSVKQIGSAFNRMGKGIRLQVAQRAIKSDMIREVANDRNRTGSSTAKRAGAGFKHTIQRPFPDPSQKPYRGISISP